MARQKSGDKRRAILAATVEIVAEHGTEATTSKIAKLAGVAEGSLFTYFENKDDLLNQLYLEIKNDVLVSMMSGYPQGAGHRKKLLHIWQANVRWGVAHPLQWKAMTQLSVSERITAENKAKVSELFAEVLALLGETITRQSLKAVPVAYPTSIFGNLADATMEFMLKDPHHADAYEAVGFEAVWSVLNE